MARSGPFSGDMRPANARYPPYRPGRYFPGAYPVRDGGDVAELSRNDRSLSLSDTKGISAYLSSSGGGRVPGHPVQGGDDRCGDYSAEDEAMNVKMGVDDVEAPIAGSLHGHRDVKLFL